MFSPSQTRRKLDLKKSWNGETRRAAAEGRAERTRRTRRAPGGKRGFIPAWEPQRRSFYTHSFRPQSSELSTGAALMCTVASRGGNCRYATVDGAGPNR
ncbi:hypothetical protein AOLI_G00026330 [Acnodon oligacanthus]